MGVALTPAKGKRPTASAWALEAHDVGPDGEMTYTVCTRQVSDKVMVYYMKHNTGLRREPGMSFSRDPTQPWRWNAVSSPETAIQRVPVTAPMAAVTSQPRRSPAEPGQGAPAQDALARDDLYWAVATGRPHGNGTWGRDQRAHPARSVA